MPFMLQMMAGSSPKSELSVSATSINEHVVGAGSSGRVPAVDDVHTSCSVLGGTPPYTFLWEKQSDANGDDFVISDATAQNPGWYGPNRNSAYGDNIETWRVTVTDDNSDTAQDTINVDLEWVEI